MKTNQAIKIERSLNQYIDSRSSFISDISNNSDSTDEVNLNFERQSELISTL